MLASFPASTLNQNQSDLEILNRFNLTPSRSSALTRGPAHFDWQLAGATRSGTAGVGDLSRSNHNDTPVCQGKFDLPQ